MLEIRDYLSMNGINAIVPEAEDHIKPMMSQEAFEQFKRKVSFSYIKKIRDPKTFGVLAINIERYETPNYIGPNTFAEIAVAFAQSKRIYLLCDLPDFYVDELAAWQAVGLQGKIDSLIDDYHKLCRMNTAQLKLF